VRADVLVPLATLPLADAVPRILVWLDRELGGDAEVVATVADQCRELSQAERVRHRAARQRMQVPAREEVTR